MDTYGSGFDSWYRRQWLRFFEFKRAWLRAFTNMQPTEYTHEAALWAHHMVRSQMEPRY